MFPSFSDLLASYSTQQLVFLIIAALVGGLARGFSGFGGALIFVPLAGAVADPKIAPPLLLIIDGIMTLGLLPDAIRRSNKSEVGVVVMGALVGVPVGTVLLAFAPPIVLRWSIAAIVFGLLIFLISGWRYNGRPTHVLSVTTGLVAGVFGGVAQLSGPPVVAYWLGGAIPAARVRANLVTYFAISTIITTMSYLGAGLLTGRTLLLALLVGPGYGIGIYFGSRMFGLASDVTFRRICFALIAGAGLVSLPVLDGLIR